MLHPILTSTLSILFLASCTVGATNVADEQEDFTQVSNELTCTRTGDGSTWCPIDWGIRNLDRHPFDRYNLQDVTEYFCDFNAGTQGEVTASYLFAYDPNDARSVRSGRAGQELRRAMGSAVPDELQDGILEFVAANFAYRTRFEYGHTIDGQSMNFDLEGSVIDSVGGAAYIWNSCGETLLTEPEKCLGLVIKRVVADIGRELLDDLADHVQRSRLHPFIKEGLQWAIRELQRWTDYEHFDEVTTMRSREFSCTVPYSYETTTSNGSCYDIMQQYDCPQSVGGCGDSKQACHANAEEEAPVICRGCYHKTRWPQRECR